MTHSEREPRLLVSFMLLGSNHGGRRCSRKIRQASIERELRKAGERGYCGNFRPSGSQVVHDGWSEYPLSTRERFEAERTTDAHRQRSRRLTGSEGRARQPFVRHKPRPLENRPSLAGDLAQASHSPWPTPLASKRRLSDFLVAHEAQERTFVFFPLVQEHEFKRSATRDLVERVFGSSVGSLVAHLLKSENVSREDIAEIRKLINQRVKK